MSSKQFLPQSIQRNFCRTPEYDFDRVAQNIDQDPQVDGRLVGNAALCEGLELQRVDGLVARTSGDEEHVLEGVLGQAAANPEQHIGNPGWVLEDATPADVEARLRGGESVEGVVGTLVQRAPEAGEYCPTTDACEKKMLLQLQQLRVTFDAAAEGVKARLGGQSNEVLANGGLLEASATQFGIFARLAAKSLFTAAGALGGPAGALLLGGVGYAVGSAVKTAVSDYAAGVQSSRLLDDGMVDAFFRSQSLAWNLGVTMAGDQALGSEHSDMRAFADAIAALANRPDIVARALSEALVPAFLRLGALTTDRPDPVHGLQGMYHFVMEIALGERGHAEPRRLVMPVSMGPEEVGMLLDVPGLLTTQAFEVVSVDQSLVGSIDVDGSASISSCDPTRAPALRRAAIPDSEERRELELAAESGDSAAQQRLEQASREGLEAVWGAILRRVGKDTPLGQIPNVKVVGAGR